MKQKTQKIILFPLIMVKIEWWLQALNNQIKRVEENINSEIYIEQVQRMADDYFLKISLKHLLDWLEELNKYVKDVEIVTKEFKSISYIKLLRDVSEYEIDYYKNNGQKQNKFINKDFNQSLIRCLIINDEYYIGGKINMNELKKILTQLYNILKQNKFTYRIEAIPLLSDLTSEPIV